MKNQGFKLSYTVQSFGELDLMRLNNYQMTMEINVLKLVNLRLFYKFVGNYLTII